MGYWALATDAIKGSATGAIAATQSFRKLENCIVFSSEMLGVFRLQKQAAIEWRKEHPSSPDMTQAQLSIPPHNRTRFKQKN
jgi:hypothetical protein